MPGQVGFLFETAFKRLIDIRRVKCDGVRPSCGTCGVYKVSIYIWSKLTSRMIANGIAVKTTESPSPGNRFKL